MIYVGIDDTDTLETRGTNQLARALVQQVRPWYVCRSIVRHQLLFDPRVPYTSKNGSASLLFQLIDDRAVEDSDLERLIELLRRGMLGDFISGSDPGLCVARRVSDELVEFGRECQRRIVAQDEARETARRAGVHLEGLGGTNQGIIGALAAVGLISTGDDGRVVQMGDWPDDLSGPTPLAALHARGVHVWDESSDCELLDPAAVIDVGKHLRPNLRRRAYTLFVRPSPAPPNWRAQKRV